jgi:glycosyltransferase involved in cell wall biosynthesis
MTTMSLARTAEPAVAFGATAGTSPARILHVFPSFSVGGVELRIADVANRLGDGFVHEAIALDGRSEAMQRLWAETPWRMRAAADGLNGVRRLPAIWARLRALRPDLVCTYNFGAMDWALANTYGVRRPHIHFESGFGPDEAIRPRRVRSAYRRLALTGVRRLVVPSEALRRIALGERWVARDRVQLVANGVDLSWYDPQIAVPTLPGLADAPVAVVAVSPLRAEKRLDRLIDLFAAGTAGTGARLVLCGDGPCARQLHHQAAKSPAAARIQFAGHLSDVRAALSGEVVFAMTSETEQSPNALIQAMAMRRPVVAFAAGDIPRILPPEQRVHVHAQWDVEGFAASLRRLVIDPGYRRVLGAANRARAEAGHDMDRMVAAYRDLYTQALEGRP